MSNQFNYNKFLDEIILEVEKELEEETTSGDAAGYQTPNAFSAGDKKSKKKTKNVATQAGYTVVNEGKSKYPKKITVPKLIRYKDHHIPAGNYFYVDFKMGGAFYQQGYSHKIHLRPNELEMFMKEKKIVVENINEGVFWPKSKLSTSFETLLSKELKKFKKGMWYVIGKDLYYNDKKVLTIGGNDSADSVIKKLGKKNITESKKLKVGDSISSRDDRGHGNYRGIIVSFTKDLLGYDKINIKKKNGKFFSTVADLIFQANGKPYTNENITESKKIKIGDIIHVRPEKRKTTSIGKVIKIGKKDRLGNTPITFKQKNGEEWNTDDKQVRKINGKVVKENQIPKKKNRWLELKNDDTMHTNKKLAKGMMNLRNQLSEVEKYLGWYNKLKNVNETEAATYWKRTNTNIRKIKERIVNIARTLQELEK